MDIADDDIDIDKRVKDLLARGLDRYGEGDPEGALAHWKHALILDPGNEKATQYASYVEDNHGLAEEGEEGEAKRKAELDYPFGIEEIGLAKLRSEELDDDYESLVIESTKTEEPLEDSVAAAAAADAGRSDSVDDGWDVDEGWVAELVEQTDAAFVAPGKGEENESSAVEATKEDSPKVEPSKKPGAVASSLDFDDGLTERPAEDAGFDDFELESHGGDKELAGKAEDVEDDDDGDYAEMEIGVASEGDIELGAVDSPQDDESDFGSLNAKDDAPDEADFGDLDLDHDSSDLDLPDPPMELGLSGPGAVPADAKPDGAGAKSIADLDLEDVAGDSGLDADEPDELEYLEDQTDDDVLAQIERDAPEGDSNERTTYIVGKLLERGLSHRDTGNFEAASQAVGQALEKADDCAAAQKLIYAQEDDLVSVLMAGLGEASKVPELVVPLTDIPLDEIDNRAAFLLTRVDGNLSLEEILIVCGMPKLEALRHLSRMHSRSYLSVG